LVIGKRRGDFNGLLENRIFNIVFVNESNGTGIEIGDTDIPVKYIGERTEINRK